MILLFSRHEPKPPTGVAGIEKPPRAEVRVLRPFQRQAGGSNAEQK